MTRRRALRFLSLHGLPAVAAVASATGSMRGWPFPERLLAAILPAGTWALEATPGIAGRGGQVAVLALAAIVLAVLVLLVRARDLHGPGGAGDASPVVDLLSGAAIAAGAVLAFAGIHRETGSNFFSHWQCWDCLARMDSPAEWLRITTGTSRTSMDSGPYRLLVLTWFAGFGASWTALRALSAACFVLALEVARRLVARGLSPQAAPVGVLLLATSPLLLDVAHTPSFLGPSILLAVATVAAYARWLDTEGERGGWALGALLLLDLYGFAPLRLLVACLPVAVGLWLWSGGGGRSGSGRPARGIGAQLRRLPRVLAPVAGLPLLAVIAALLTGGGDTVDLVYADGEFAPAARLADGDRFRVVGPDEVEVDAIRSARELGLLSLDTGWVGPMMDDGRAPPTVPLHAPWVLLGLAGLAAGVWRSRLGWLLGSMIAVHFAALALTYPLVLRRMPVYFAVLLLAGAGGFELLRRVLGGAGGAVRWGVGLGVGVPLAVAAVGMAIAAHPGIARPPTAAEQVADPCEHQRELADRALGRGHALVLVHAAPPGEGLWTACQGDIVEGNWVFQRWRSCRGGGSGGRIGTLLPPGESGIDPAAVYEHLADRNLAAVGAEVPPYWLGDGPLLLVLDTAADGELLTTLEGAPNFARCPEE